MLHLKYLLALAAVASLEAKAGPGDVTAVASFQNDSLALPWTQRLDAPMHPGARAGLEWRWFGSARHQLLQNVTLGFSSAPPVQQLVTLLTCAAYRFTLEPGVQFEAGIGLGHGHEFLGSTVYRAAVGSSFAASANVGRPQALFGLAVGAGFDFRRTLRWPVDVFVRYEPMFQWPYAPSVPVLPHVNVSLGVRWHFDSPRVLL